MTTTGNIIRCPSCRLALIAEESLTHECQVKPFQWFFEGDWFFGTESEGWAAINWKHPSDGIFHGDDLGDLRRRLPRTESTP